MAQKENNVMDEVIEQMKKEVEELEEKKLELKKTRKERTKKIKKTEDEEVKKRKCKLCGELKEPEKFVIDRKLDNGKIRFKTKCLDCYKEISKKYYAEKKEKILNDMSKINEKKKKTYSYNIKFNDIDDLNKQMETLKDKLDNKELIEIKKPFKQRKRKGDNGGGSNSSPVILTN